MGQRWGSDFVINKFRSSGLWLKKKKKKPSPFESTNESESEVAQLCPILWDPMDCNLSGCSVHGIFQARVLEWIAISFSRGSSRPRNRTWVSCIAGRHFTIWATRETNVLWIICYFCRTKTSVTDQAMRITYKHTHTHTYIYIHIFSHTPSPDCS